jgi:hypothetical protein
MAQAVEQLPSKDDALSSNPSIAKRKRKKKKKIKGKIWDKEMRPLILCA